MKDIYQINFQYIVFFSPTLNFIILRQNSISKVQNTIGAKLLTHHIIGLIESARVQTYWVYFTLLSPLCMSKDLQVDVFEQNAFTLIK